MTTSEKARSKGAPLREIQFHANGTPTGTSKCKFANHVAFMMRNQVSCTFKTWALVPDTLKEAVWVDIKTFWNIDNDKFKDKIKKYMGRRWKAWKTRLQFKAYVASVEFRNRSAMGRENGRKINIHPHRLGSCGYETTLLKWRSSRGFTWLRARATPTGM